MRRSATEGALPIFSGDVSWLVPSLLASNLAVSQVIELDLSIITHRLRP